MPWLVALTSLLALALAVRAYIVRKQLESVAGQLRMMSEKPLPNMIVRLDKAGPGFRGLVEALNALRSEERARALELERQQRLLQAQISSISHDLRTPLTSVLGYLELAAEEKDAEKRCEYLDIVRRRAGILQTLIVDFYDLSCLEDPDKPLLTELLAPTSILEDTILTFYEKFTKKDLGLELKIDDSGPVRGSRPELVRVYTNLLQNILNYGAGWAEICHEENAGEIHTRFTNTLAEGVTFELDRLFERFYTGDQSRGGQGTGLGLYTVKLLLTKMGHDIRVEYRDGLLSFIIDYGHCSSKK